MFLFGRGDSRIYSAAADIPSIYRYILTSGVVGVMAICWWLCVYRPIEAHLIDYVHRNNALRTECESAVNDMRNMRTLHSSIEQLKSEPAMTDRSNAQKPWITTVIETAHTAGLKITAYHADAACLKDWYSCVRARFDLVGSWQSLLTFLRQLRAAVPTLGCKQWSVRTADNGTYAFSCTFNLISFTACGCDSAAK